MSQALNYADVQALHQQKAYADQHNKRAVEKSFEPGEFVIVLYPTSTNKLLSRWHGPCQVLQRKSKHSYLIDMNNQGHKIVHANKLKKYYVRGMNCIALLDDDENFGEVIEQPLLINDSEPLKIAWEQISHLNDNQRRELLQLLEEFVDRFSNKAGLCKVVKHEINLSNDFVPRQFQAYRVPLIYRQDVEKQITQLLKDQIIRPSNSAMASPLVIVKKKSGDLRLACDFRYINKHTVQNYYPMPMMADVLNKVAKAKYISVFDCRNAYWSCEVKESDKWKTCFISHVGTFEWNRVPFGMVDSGRTFVKAIDIVLRPIKSFCEPYVDDIAVHSDAWENHLNHIRQFLQTMREHNLTLNLNKCEFGKKEIKFIGHIVGSGNIKMDWEKIEAIKNLKRPANKKEVKQLLGFFGFYRVFVCNFAEIAKSLTDLTKKDKPYNVMWLPEHEDAFQCLKNLICSNQVLVNFEIGRVTNVYCDSSDYACGAVLTQVTEDNTERPVAFISCKLTETQRNWAAIEKEAYSVIWALNKFKIWVLGHHTTVFTDHNPLIYVLNNKSKSTKLMRWCLALQSFDIELKYKKGSLNLVADTLSRMSVENSDILVNA